jgi:hypothetical protein
MTDSEPRSPMAQLHPMPRTYTVTSLDERDPSTTVQTFRHQAEPFEQEINDTPALGRGAAAAIAGATERVGDTIRLRLDELGLLRADIDREAADFVRHMAERADTLQAHIESYARQCQEVQQQIKDAGKRLDPMSRPAL